MGPASYALVLLVTVLALTYTPSPATASPAPGHLAIPYYINQKKEKERLETEKLKIRCQSYIESGYYSDPKCEEVYLQTFHYSGSPTTSTLAPSLLVAVVVAMIRTIWH